MPNIYLLIIKLQPTLSKMHTLSKSLTASAHFFSNFHYGFNSQGGMHLERIDYTTFKIFYLKKNVIVITFSSGFISKAYIKTGLRIVFFIICEAKDLI